MYIVLQRATQVISRFPWDQFLPILLVFIIAPLLALGAYSQAVKAESRLSWFLTMVLENLGLGFVWNWMHGAGHGDVSSKSSGSNGESKVLKKKHLRRAEQIAAARAESNKLEGYYPGLINISGTYCFLNSTLQAMASLSYLQPYIQAIHSRAERFDVPSPVIDAFLDILTELNTPNPHSKALRPVEIINALSTPTGKDRRSALFSSREHQDAQELFQLLSEMVKNESKAVDDETSRDRGLLDLRREPSPELLATAKGSIFYGLTANRRSCVECGYTEAVMHFAFDSLQLAIPRMASCQLEDCLADYTRLELLNDCICRKCSLLATHEKLLAEAEKFTDAVSAASEKGTVSSSKKKRAREARKLEARVKAALEEGRIEDDIKDVKLERVFSRCSTKQSMIARTPSVLVLHLNRSIHYGMSGVKNTCRVLFPEFLDLTPFTTSGQLSTLPSAPISSPFQLPRRPSTPTLSDPQPSRYIPQVLYRLSAVVCHYGTHSFGHYVAYRRKPLPISTGARRWDPPTLRCPLDCECEKCAVYGPIRDEDEKGKVMRPSSRWLRISDDSVDEVGLERVLTECAGTFMLYYEKVVMGASASSRPPSTLSLSSSVAFSPQSETPLTPRSTPSPSRSTSQDLMDLDLDADLNITSSSSSWPIRNSPRSSEETIKPVREHNGYGHLSPSPDSNDHDLTIRGRGQGDLALEQLLRRERRLEARIVRSVYAGRSPRHGFRDFSPASTCTLESVSVAAVSEDTERDVGSEGEVETETEIENMLAGEGVKRKKKKKNKGQANGHVEGQHALSQSMPDLPLHSSSSSAVTSSLSHSFTSPVTTPSSSSYPSPSTSHLQPQASYYTPHTRLHSQTEERTSQLETPTLSEGLTA